MSASPHHATTALLFQTHFLDWPTARFIRQLAKQVGPKVKVFVVLNLKDEEVPPQRLAAFPHHITRTEQIRTARYPNKSFGQDWNLWHGGHSDLIALDFFRAHPDFAHYWVMEYDVRYSGHWGHFLEELAETDADLLATTLRRRDDHPGWCFWESLQGPGSIPSQKAIAGFLPIHRASNAAMRAMDAAYQVGWTGHLEVAWPTLVARAGLKVADLGGTGPFTPEALRGRFYSNTFEDLHLAPGSFIFKPAMHRPGTVANRLWHPVKPYRFRDELRTALGGFRASVMRLPALMQAGR